MILSMVWLKSDNMDLEYATSYIKVIEHGQCLSYQGNKTEFCEFLGCDLTTDMILFVDDRSILSECPKKITRKNKSVFIRRKRYL